MKVTVAHFSLCLTVDVETDCPPYLQSARGLDEGLERVLALFGEESIRATFFVTGQVAVSHPGMIGKIVSLGHELGSHGLSHQAFDTIDLRTAAQEIHESMNILTGFSSIRSFRAPYLRFPDSCLELLVDAGFSIDSSQARYKLSCYRKPMQTSLTRIPVSMTSSVLRLPGWICRPFLNALFTTAFNSQMSFGEPPKMRTQDPPALANTRESMSNSSGIGVTLPPNDEDTISIRKR